MRRWLAVLMLGSSACFSAAAQPAARFTGTGFSIQLPEGWGAQRDRMGVALIARPAKAEDPEGWGVDLVTVTREAVDAKRTCLEGFGYRKLEQLAYHAEKFSKLAQEDLTLGGKPATLLTLRYTEGTRELMAYVLILADGSHMLTATALSSPARFEARRAPFRFALESLRAR